MTAQAASIATAHNRTSNVAILIDWENIKCSTIENLRTPPDILTLKKIARRFGSLRIGRAYANWTDPSGWHAGDVERFVNLGIEPVFVATRHFDHDGKSSYEKDLVDLRLACDGMELLASHPEIDCFVVVSGDGALETLLSKLGSAGKRIVRVAVRKSLSQGTRVLGEERVQYDDWIRGFRLGHGSDVQQAVKKFVDAVRELTAERIPAGLDAVKIRIRGRNPEFEEEELGIPSFRHLAFLAEAHGELRINASREPAIASLEEDAAGGQRGQLPSGKAWADFLHALDPNTDYTKPGIQATIGDQTFDGGLEFEAVLNAAIKSDVIVRFSGQMVGKDQATEQAKVMWTNKFRVNIHHPRVQVVLGMRKKTLCPAIP